MINLRVKINGSAVGMPNDQFAEVIALKERTCWIKLCGSGLQYLISTDEINEFCLDYGNESVAFVVKGKL
jgi:hypothetical protein